MEKQVSTPATTNIFTRRPQGTLRFSTDQVWVLVKDGYDTQNTVLYWNFTDIIEWCKLKANIPVIRVGIYFGDNKINYLKELTWWGAYLTLQGEISI